MSALANNKKIITKRKRELNDADDDNTLNYENEIENKYNSINSKEQSANRNIKEHFCRGVKCLGKYRPLVMFEENGEIYKTCNECRAEARKRYSQNKKRRLNISNTNKNINEKPKQKVLDYSILPKSAKCTRGRSQCNKYIPISNFIENGELFKICNKCRKKLRSRYKRVISEGKCQTCGKKLSAEWQSSHSKTRCIAHLEKNRIYMHTKLKLNPNHYHDIQSNVTNMKKTNENRKNEIEIGFKQCFSKWCKGKSKPIKEFPRWKGKTYYKKYCIECGEKSKTNTRKYRGDKEQSPISY